MRDLAVKRGKVVGRPSSYSEEMAETICTRISEGESLRSICEGELFPNKSTVMRWLAEREDFATRYARAREMQADALFDEMLEIADDGRNDWMERRDKDDENIGWRENGEAMRRSDLRIKTRQWMAAKLQPKKYGEKLDLAVSGKLETVPEEQIESRIADLLGKAGVDVAPGREGPSKADK